ncbi:MAG TPA: M48 family metallopeptidase [Terriglobales bacterium]|nr:M48 family metallopeptidase [Terriglobales bacterium]
MKIRTLGVLAALSFFLAASCLLVQAQSAPQPSGVQSASTAPKKIIEYSLPPDKLEKSHALYLQIVRFQVIDTVYGFVILLAFLYFGIAARFRNIAEKKSQNKWLQGLIVFPLFILTMTVLSIPSDLYHQHVRLLYGLSVQSWGSWWADWGKTLLLSLALETFLLLLLYWLIRISPRRWWFYGWLIGIPIIVFIMFIAPIVIEPLYFTYSPLDQTNPELVTQIERVVKRGGLDIPRSRMYSMNASTKYTGDNAYVSGFGASKRVVVWDTTQKHMTSEEIMFVFGHEMGHYVLNHIVKGIGAALLLLLVLLFLAYMCSDRAVRHWGAKWQIRGFSDMASVPLLVLLLGVFSFISTPLQNGVTRYLEHQADTYGLEAIHGLVPDSQAVAASAFQKLGENWLEYPGEGDFFEWWSQDHPITRKRMHYAQEYDPWGKGKEPEFVK